jgi:hypothetical protein
MVRKYHAANELPVALLRRIVGDLLVTEPQGIIQHVGDLNLKELTTGPHTLISSKEIRKVIRPIPWISLLLARSDELSEEEKKSLAQSSYAHETEESTDAGWVEIRAPRKGESYWVDNDETEWEIASYDHPVWDRQVVRMFRTGSGNWS